MFFWVRELFGWLLLAAAIFLIKTALGYTENRQVVEAGVVSIMALGTMRAGLLLIRVSTAARIALRQISTPE